MLTYHFSILFSNEHYTQQVSSDLIASGTVSKGDEGMKRKCIKNLTVFYELKPFPVGPTVAN